MPPSILRPSLQGWIARAVCVGAFLLAALLFGRAQEIWVDETTQLSGLTLDPIEVVRWLAGEDRDRFGVPGDRMPPLSYWLGWGWSQVAGLSENSLRLLSAVSVALAVLLLVDAAESAFGTVAAWITGLWFGLAPTVVTLGVEIRAYPFLALGAAGACWGLQRLCVASPERARRQLVIIGISCLFASYSHFFGVVLFGASTLGATYVCLRRNLGWLGPALLVGGFAIGALGLVPFLLSAVQMSADSPPAHPPLEVVKSGLRLWYRVLGGHPALGAYRILAASVPLAAVGCIVLAAINLLRSSLLFGALAIGVTSGFAVTTLTQLVVGSVDAHTVSYNTWMLPMLALLVGAVGAPNSRRSAARAGWALAGVGNLGVVIGCGLLLVHAPTYAHGAGERVAERLAAEGAPSAVTVLHDEASDWGFAYFPLRYLFGTELRQFLVAAEQGTPTLARLPARGAGTVGELSGRQVALLSTRMQRFEDLGSYVTGGAVPSYARPELVQALARAGCQATDAHVYVAFMGTELRWLQCK